MTRTSPLSRTGLSFAALYVLSTGFFIYDAMTCVGMLCDLFGFILTCLAFALLWGIYKLLDQAYAFPIFDVEAQDYLLLPSYILNIVVFYELGKLCGWAVLKLKNRQSNSKKSSPQTD